MNKLFFTILFLITCNFNLYGKSIDFIGLKNLSLSDLKTISKIDLDKDTYTKNEINTLINDLYESDLIYEVNFQENKNSFIIEIKESKIINDLYFNNNTYINDDQILSIISSKKNTLLSRNKILKDVDVINSIYRAKGFSDIFTVAKIEKFSENKLNLIFEINEGNQSKINNIRFEGNTYYSDRYLSSLISSQSLQFYNIFKSGSNLRPEVFEYDKNQILNFYNDQGFFDVKVEYDIEASRLGVFSLIFYINEGVKYNISEVKYDESILESDFIQNLDKNFKNKLNKNNYNYDAEIINNYLTEINNLLFANNINNYFIDLQTTKNDSAISLNFIRVEQVPININKINIYGNKITKDKTIRSKITLEPGDTYNTFIIKQDIKKLIRLPYIKSANYEEPNLMNQNNIDFTIDENTKTGNILFAGTYDSDTDFGLTFGIEDKNFIGSGNTIDLNFNFNSENLRYDLNYIQYPIFNSYLSNQYSIFNQENDYTSSFGYKAKRQGFGYNLNFSKDYRTSLNFGASYEMTEGHSAKNNSTSAITDNIGNFDNLILSFSIKKDTTNDIFNPTDGYFNKLNFLISPNELSDNAYYKIKFINKNYFKIKKSNNFIFLNNNAGYAKSLKSKLKTINAFSLGGSNFKGFEYKGIGPKTDGIYLGGNQILTTTLGYGSSFLFDEKDNVNIKLFLTSGSIWDSDYVSNNDFKLRSSAGISLDFLTAVGPISFTYASPIDKQNDDNKRNFSFSIGSSF